MSNLPPEILSDILSRLPPKDVIRSLSVSKGWYALIHDRHFIKAHLQRSKSALTILLTASDSHLFSFNDSEDFGTAVKTEQPLKCGDMLGSSVHGLVFIHNCLNGDIVLWNPSIQKFKKIPIPIVERQQPTSNPYARYGFGYDSVNDDYKVLAIVDIRGTFEIHDSYGWHVYLCEHQVHIYSLKSNSWKMMEYPPCNGFPFGPVSTNNIVFFNGALCWLIYADMDTKVSRVLTLDLASEKYQEFSSPVNKEEYYPAILVVLQDCLCFSVNCYKTRHDVWIMKEYGVAESWTLLYSIVQEARPWSIRHYSPLAFSKNGKMVLLRSDSNRIFWFDLEKKREKQAAIHGLPIYFSSTICVDVSLCLLDGDPVIVGGRSKSLLPLIYDRKLSNTFSIG